VRSIDEPEKKPKEIDNWISSITDLHRQKPPQNVHYTKTMPDIETLMQEWPPEFEDMLKSINLPSADLDCELTEYIDVICGMYPYVVRSLIIHPKKIMNNNSRLQR